MYKEEWLLRRANAQSMDLNNISSSKRSPTNQQSTEISLTSQERIKIVLCKPPGFKISIMPHDPHYDIVESGLISSEKRPTIRADRSSSLAPRLGPGGADRIPHR